MIIASAHFGSDRAARGVFHSNAAPDARLARLENLRPLPHIGSATVKTRAAMGPLQRRNLAAVLAGKPPVTPVNSGGEPAHKGRKVARR